MLMQILAASTVLYGLQNNKPWAPALAGPWLFDPADRLLADLDAELVTEKNTNPVVIGLVRSGLSKARKEMAIEYSRISARSAGEADKGAVP